MFSGSPQPGLRPGRLGDAAVDRLHDQVLRQVGDAAALGVADLLVRPPLAGQSSMAAFSSQGVPSTTR